MDYKVLYRKYRPQIFDDISGQDYLMQILKNAIKYNKIAHAYIFTGPRGTGKTSTAKIFAKAINCNNLENGNPCGKCNCCINENNPDIIEIDAASNNGVDEIRELINNVKIAPTYSKYKVYIIDEVHMLSTSAFNALLLTLEDPPGNVVFILATTDIQNVPVTILSRCQRFDFKPISDDKIFERLKYVCDLEHIEASEEALKEIAYVSNGGLRDALSILDQLSSNKNEINIEDVYQNFGTVSSIKIEELVNSFLNNDFNKVCNIINEFKENGINYIVLVEKLINKLKETAIEFKSENNNISFNNIYNLIVELNDCMNSANINLNPYILIELTIIKYINNDKNYFPGNNLVEEKIQNNISQEIKNIEKSSNIISREIIKEETISDNTEEKETFNTNLIEIRVNNCFVKANKTYKNELIEIWKEFIDQLQTNNRSLYSIVIDSTLELASDEYIVLVVEQESVCNLVNLNLNLINQEFLKYINKKYKFICLTKEKWHDNMELFKNNKKNGIIYKYINEDGTEISEKIISDTSEEEITTLAEDLFDSNIIEYE